jgi:hypothetical protein
MKTFLHHIGPSRTRDSVGRSLANIFSHAIWSMLEWSKGSLIALLLVSGFKSGVYNPTHVLQPAHPVSMLQLLPPWNERVNRTCRPC